MGMGGDSQTEPILGGACLHYNGLAKRFLRDLTAGISMDSKGPGTAHRLAARNRLRAAASPPLPVVGAGQAGLQKRTRRHPCRSAKGACPGGSGTVGAA